mgnify:CR=1 FL=1
MIGDLWVSLTKKYGKCDRTAGVLGPEHCEGQDGGTGAARKDQVEGAKSVCESVRQRSSWGLRGPGDVSTSGSGLEGVQGQRTKDARGVQDGQTVKRDRLGDAVGLAVHLEVEEPGWRTIQPRARKPCGNTHGKKIPQAMKNAAATAIE